MEALNSRDFDAVVKGAMEILSTEGTDGEGEEIYPVELRDIASSLASDYESVRSAVEEGTKGQNPLYVKLNERQGDDSSMLVLFKVQYDELCKRICAELESFHKSNPLKAGVGREELRSKVCRLWDNKMFSDMLAKMVEEGKLKLVGNEVSLASHKVVVSQENDLLVNFVERAFTEQLFAPPLKSKVMTDCKSPRSCESVFKFLQDNGRLVRVGQDMFFHRDAVDKALEVAKKLGTTGEGFTVAQFRDEVGTSRKYAVALLEYMDNQKKTRRNGGTTGSSWGNKKSPWLNVTCSCDKLAMCPLKLWFQLKEEETSRRIAKLQNVLMCLYCLSEDIYMTEYDDLIL